MPGIVRQSDQYAVFDTETRYPKERVAREVPPEVVAEYTRGRSVGTGMLNPGNRTGSRHYAADVPAQPGMSPGPTHMPWNGAGAPAMHGPGTPGDVWSSPGQPPTVGGTIGESPYPEAPPPGGRTPTPVAPGRLPGTNPQIPLAPGFGESPIHVGVNVHGLDPNEHAYATEDYPGPGPGRHFDPNTGYQPSEEDERRMEMIGDDDASGYNWGPAPHPGDPGPGPHPDFHGDAPHPFGTPVYNPGGGYDNHLGSRLGFTH